MTQNEMRESVMRACAMLNEACQRDPNAMYFLQGYRIPCKESLASDVMPIVVDRVPVLNMIGAEQEPMYQVGMIGVITGIFDAMGFPCTLCTRWSEAQPDGRRQFLGFGVVDFGEVKNAQ